jgi:hypothetical protein
MKTKKPKHFLISGRYDISLVIEADSKNEALAFTNEEFNNLIKLDTDGLVGLGPYKIHTIKLKKPKRFKDKVLVVSTDNNN